MSDISSVISYFAKPQEGFVTTLASTIGATATTVPLNGVAGLTNGDTFVGIVDPGATAQQVFTGIVDTSGVQITSVVWTDGTDVTHPAGTTVVDYPTASQASMVSEGILKEHKQTGLHSDITADTIVIADAGTLDVDTINEATAANGVTIDGLNVKDSKLVTADSVVAANLTDGIVANAHLDTTAGEPGGAWDTWTPTWTDFTIGNGTQAWAYTQIGKTVICRGHAVLGSTSSMSTSISGTLPVTASTYYTTGSRFDPVGVCLSRDDSTGNQYPGATRLVVAGDQFTVDAALASGTYLEQQSFQSGVPFTWATNDSFHVTFTYEAA